MGNDAPVVQPDMINAVAVAESVSESSKSTEIRVLMDETWQSTRVGWIPWVKSCGAVRPWGTTLGQSLSPSWLPQTATQI